MKNIKYILSASALTLLAACAQVEEPEYVKGQPDLEGCYGVYFPEAGVSETLDPTQEPKKTFRMVRTVYDGAITVPVVVSASEEGIFEVGEVSFEDGQKETTFEVTFPNAKEGVQYKLNLSVEDPQYASVYMDYPLSVSYSVMRVSWVYFGVDASGQEIAATNPAEAARVTWKQTIWGETHTGIIKYYEVNGVRTCVTVTEPLQYEQGTGYGFWGTADAPAAGTEVDSKYELSFYWYPSKDNVLYLEEPQFVYVESQFDGQPHNAYFADYYVYYNFFNAQYKGGWPNAESFYTTNESQPRNYYDGNGGFYFMERGICLEGTTAGIWGKDGDQLVGMADGFIRVDYSINVEADYTDNGTAAVSFVCGADVAKIKYAIYEGKLSESDKKAKAGEIASGKESTAREIEVEDGSAEISVTLQNSGIYTIVAVACDKSGTAQDYDSAAFSFVASGEEEEYTVALTCGITSAERHKGVNTDTNLEIYAYGEDIQVARAAVFSAMDLVSDQGACVNALLQSEPLTAQQLEAINGAGWSAVVGGLMPGTEYYLLVYAANEYSEKLFISKASAKTTGKPLPIYDNYTLDSLVEELMTSKSEDLFGQYNFYGRDIFGDNPSMRTFLGKVTISDSDTPDSEPDADGLKDEYVNISGFFANSVAAGFIGSDKLEFDYYDGMLYWIPDQTLPEGPKGYSGAVYVGDSSKDKWGYTANMALLGIPVADGYLAFVANPGYNGQGFNFDGICSIALKDGAQQGWLEKIADILIVDPAKDDNGVAPASVQKKLNAIRNAKYVYNYVELPEYRKYRAGEAIKAAVDAADAVEAYNDFMTVQGRYAADAVGFGATPVERKSGKAERIFSRNQNRRTDIVY